MKKAQITLATLNQTLASCLVALVLTACGGGGGDSGGAPPAINIPPIARAGLAQTVIVTSTVSLSAAASSDASMPACS